LCGSAAEYIDRIDDLPPRLGAIVADAALQQALKGAGVKRARMFGWDEGARRLLAVLDEAAHTLKGDAC
jgi:hypothetical protein